MGCCVSVIAKPGGIWSPVAPSLAPLAKEALGFASSDRAEDCGCAPVPTLLPAPLLEPGEACSNLGHVQNWRDGLTSICQRIAKALIGNEIFLTKLGSADRERVAHPGGISLSIRYLY